MFIVIHAALRSGKNLGIHYVIDVAHFHLRNFPLICIIEQVMIWAPRLYLMMRMMQMK